MTMSAELEEGDPIEYARQFAANQAARGFQLDFSLESLEREVDRLLELPIFRSGRSGSPSVEQE